MSLMHTRALMASLLQDNKGREDVYNLHSLPIDNFKPALRIARRRHRAALIALLSALITRGLSVRPSSASVGSLVGASLDPLIPSFLPFPRTEIISWIGTSRCAVSHDHRTRVQLD